MIGDLFDQLLTKTHVAECSFAPVANLQSIHNNRGVMEGPIFVTHFDDLLSFVRCQNVTYKVIINKH